ncbi:unnamed protein product, partial [Urochloa humidicola]
KKKKKKKTHAAAASGKAQSKSPPPRSSPLTAGVVALLPQMAASEEAEAAAVVEAVAARAREQVVALLAPGGLLSVEDAGKTVADSVRSCVTDVPGKKLAVTSQDIEKLAIAAATATLTVIIFCGAGSLNAPHSMVEEAITKAIAAASAQVGDTGTSSAYSFAFWCLVVIFFLWVTTIAIFAFCLGY